MGLNDRMIDRNQSSWLEKGGALSFFYSITKYSSSLLDRVGDSSILGADLAATI